VNFQRDGLQWRGPERRELSGLVAVTIFALVVVKISRTTGRDVGAHHAGHFPATTPIGTSDAVVKGIIQLRVLRR
jgi:hypothetical protein